MTPDEADRLIKALQYDLKSARDTLMHVGAFMILDAGGRKAHLDVWRVSWGSASVRDVADAISKMESARRRGESVLTAITFYGLRDEK